jgi:hypothetical protein
MGIQLERRPVHDGFDASDRGDGLEMLLHPAQTFEHPDEVVRDPNLTLNEKRSILASWASDACAVESAPALRASAGDPVTFDSVMDALRAIDEVAGKYGKPNPRYRQSLSKRSVAPSSGPGRPH